MTPVERWDILFGKLKVGVLEARKVGKREDLSVFDEGEIVLARRPGRSISKNRRSRGVFPGRSG